MRAYIVYILIALIVLLLALSGYLFFENKDLTTALAASREQNTELTSQNLDLGDDLAEASTTIAALSEKLDLTTEELDEVTDDYKQEKQKNDDFEDEYRKVIKTVYDLDKLSKTDSELLQKYSKVSFLNEHYIPESLKEIKPEWKYNEDKPNQLHTKVMPFFEKMLKDAKDDGINLYVVSAYRSFDTQAQLKGAYTVQYGTGANTFSADQGFSEHQLGTTVDFTTSGIGGGLDGFDNTPASDWLEENAYKYGFILSYPKGNSYYVYEPWHWRFVGEDLARDLNRSDKNFYDLDQREIDKYLLNIFD